MSKYRRLTDGLNRIGKLIPADANPYDYVKDKNKDWYLSIYKYSEDHKKMAEEMVTVDGRKRKRGITGIEDVTTNVLGFDLDLKNDLEKARKETVMVCERLDSMGIPFDRQNISFSGGKGFSVVVYHDKELTPKEHRNIADNIAHDLKSFDTSLYNASRIFRLDYTKHNKSGLYKTPLAFDELRSMTIEEIKGIAKDSYDTETPVTTYLPKKVFEFKDKSIEPVIEKEPSDLNIKHSIDFTKKPTYLTDVKYALHKGFIPEGQGNTGMMILAATYKHVGFDKTDAYHMLKAVNEKRSEIYGIEKRSKKEIYKEVIDVVYSPHWKGGTYNDKENDLLIKTARHFNITEKGNIVEINQVKNRFIDFAENINKNVIRTGIRSLDESIMITTGMMVGLLAAPSAGKTSMATKIVENLSKNDQNVLFLSLDMHDTLLYSRLLQRVSGLDISKKLRSKIETDKNYNPEYSFTTDKELESAFGNVENLYKNVNFDFTRGCTIESIEENIKASKAKYGDKLKMVVVDYLEKVRGPYSDATANSGYVASRLSDLASTYDVAILLLLQPQKSAGDPSEELLSMRKVKGASVIEQDCRVILTMWRPGFSPKDSVNDCYASVAVVKNNMGPVTQIDFGWSGLKGEFKELTQNERDNLETLRENRRAEKEEENNGYNI